MANELVTKSYDIDISKTGARPIVRLSQYDTRTVRVLFTVYDGTELQVIDGCTARIDGRRSDGTAFTAPCDIEQGSKVGFTVESEMTSAAGMHEAELVIINADGNPLGTQNFTLAVEKAPFDRESAATTDDRTLYDQYTTAVDTRVTAAIRKADDAVTADTEKVDKLVSDTQAKIDAIVSKVVTPSEFQSLSAEVSKNTESITRNAGNISTNANGISALSALTVLYSSGGWYVCVKCGYVWVYANGITTSADAYGSTVCPYTIDQAYRPKIDILGAPVYTLDSGTSNGRLVVQKDGRINVSNAGGDGSAKKRYGFVCYPVGI